MCLTVFGWTLRGIGGELKIENNNLRKVELNRFDSYRDEQK